MSAAIEASATDEQLVAGIVAGDSESFTALHDRYRERVYRFALKRMGDEAEAEDVTQEVFFQVWRCIGSYQGRSTLLTWIFGVAHNQVCRRFRKNVPAPGAFEDAALCELPSEEAGAEERLDAQRMLERCDQVVDDLSEGQRQVFHLRFRENRSTRSIASALGKSNQAVKISLFRTRRALAERTPARELELTAA